MTDNAKTRENLQTLADFVNTKSTSLGFADGPDGSPALPGETLSKGINAPDTWTSTLADQEAESVKAPFNTLADDFVHLHQTLVAEKNSSSLADDGDSSN